MEILPCETDVLGLGKMDSKRPENWWVWEDPPRRPFHNGTETDSVLHHDRVAYCWPSSFLPPYCQGHAWQYWTENLGIFISPFGTILFSIQFWNVFPWHIWKTWIGKMLSSEFSQLSFPRHSGLLEMCHIRQSSPPFSHVPQVSPFHSVKSALSQRSHTCPLTPSGNHLSFGRGMKEGVGGKIVLYFVDLVLFHSICRICLHFGHFRGE